MSDSTMMRAREHTTRECVQRGAAWLDENKPGWQGSVDPGTLSIENPDVCVIGQVFREEYRANQDLYTVEGAWGYWREEFPDLNPVELGFDGGFLNPRDYDSRLFARELTAIWREYLAEYTRAA